MNRISISIGILFVLVLAVYAPTWLTEDASVPLSEQEEAWRPNYQARNMRSTLYDNLGNVNHQVFAEKMEHYQLLGFTLFRQPQYQIFVKDQTQPWQVFAAEGTLYEDNRILLETDVLIQNLSPEGFVQQIKTQFIEIDLEQKTMTSDQPVEIFGENYVVRGNGFIGDMLSQQYELTNHVQTVYQPAP